MFFILAKGLVRIWEESNEKQFGMSGGMIYLISQNGFDCSECKEL
jgi:hypothetical protein